MKSIVTCAIIFTLFALNGHAQQTSVQLTAKERQDAVKFLKETEKAVYATVKNLNDEQLNFKPAPNVWSVAECVKHIAASEKTLWAMADQTMSQPVNPQLRDSIKVTDEQLVKAVEDRSHKSTTFAALEPANSPYATTIEALAAFKADRDKLIAYLNTTKDDLRNHVLVLPIGTFDAYQYILLLSAHTNRHTQQIQEVMNNPAFPKK